MRQAQWYYERAMTRHSLRVLCLGLAAVISGHTPLNGQGDPSTRPPTQVYFSAAGKGDTPPVPNVSELEFSIDKQPAQASSLRSAGGDKLLFAVLVDFSGSGFYQAASIKMATMQVLQGLLDGKNEGRLIVFNDRVTAGENSIDLPEAQRILGLFHFYGGTALYDAIADTSTRHLSMAGNPSTPRRAIIVITDGEDNSSSITLDRAKEVAEQERVAVFSLQARNEKVMNPEEIRHGARALKEISESTGGLAFFPKKLEDGVQPLLKTIHEQWVIDLEPALALDQKQHSLIVKSSQKGIELSVPAHVSTR